MAQLSRRRKALFSLFVTCFVLGVCEVGQRISDWRKYERRDRRDGAKYSLVLATAAGQVLEDEPGAIALVHHPLLAYKARAHRPRDGLAINAQGFRGADWELERRPGVRRVLILGGSVAFGHGCSSDGTTVAARLGERLAAAGEAVEVLNGAVIGYDSAQELALLVSEALDYRPDVVVVLDGWNDFHQAGHRGPGQPILPAPFLSFDEAATASREPGRVLLRASALFRGLERRVGALRRRAADRASTDTLGLYHDRPDAVQRYRKNLARLVRICRAEGARVVVAAQPELYQRKGDLPEAERRLRERIESGDAPYARAGYRAYAERVYPAYVAAARAAAEAEEAAFVDATVLFDGLADAVFIDFCHLDDRGHEVLADALAPAVRAQLPAR